MFVLNASRIVDCIDSERTVGEVFRNIEGMEARADDYFMVGKLILDPARANGIDVLRPAHWTQPLIVSQKVVDVLDARDLDGVTLASVT